VSHPYAKENIVTVSRPAAATRSAPSRAGFTLVELLVVIAIIALLAALITPAVISARTSARNGAIKAEIDMLHMAMMNYKNEYGSFPPCSALGMPPTTDPAIKHLVRLFPRMSSAPAQFLGLSNLFGTATGGPILPSNAICRWLFGYTDDPTLPVTGGNRKKLYDFDQARIGKTSTNAGYYYPAGKPGSPYVYIDAAFYPTVNVTLPGSVAPYTAQKDPVTGQFLNPDTFQILCAGLDEVFGNDDDLSNSWSGTRKQYLDSLK
jgi:prepilin-type N-terminal cleavage/methylation domain-containing protein